MNISDDPFGSTTNDYYPGNQWQLLTQSGHREKRND